jgi:dephospho-CoA kinase
MKIVGITGLIASGKTQAARVFEKLGAVIIDADREAHNVLLKSGAAYAGVLAEFGEEILDSDGEIDRKKLGRIVFSDKAKLERLNGLTHKHIMDNIRRSISTITATPSTSSSVIIDAVFLYEAGLHEICDFWIYVDAEEEVRLERVLSRDNMGMEAAISRVESQKHLKTPEKLAKANIVLTNNGGIDEFIIKTEELARNVLENC